MSVENESTKAKKEVRKKEEQFIKPQAKTINEEATKQAIRDCEHSKCFAYA